MDFFFSGLASAFEKRKWNTEVVDFGVPYDFASIMHYPFTAFSKNGKPTIRNIVDMQGKTPYIVLSDGDARQTNAMYKCNGKEILHLLEVNTAFISCQENRKQRISVTFQIICRNVRVCKGIWIPESGKLLLAESGKQLKEFRIPQTNGMKIPSSTDKEWNPVRETRIQDCLGFPYMAKEYTIHPPPPTSLPCQ